MYTIEQSSSNYHQIGSSVSTGYKKTRIETTILPQILKSEAIQVHQAQAQVWAIF